MLSAKIFSILLAIGLGATNTDISYNDNLKKVFYDRILQNTEICHICYGDITCDIKNIPQILNENELDKIKRCLEISGIYCCTYHPAHTYHTPCFLEWYKEHKSCSTCREANYFDYKNYILKICSRFSTASESDRNEVIKYLKNFRIRDVIDIVLSICFISDDDFVSFKVMIQNTFTKDSILIFSNLDHYYENMKKAFAYFRAFPADKYEIDEKFLMNLKNLPMEAVLKTVINPIFHNDSLELSVKKDYFSKIFMNLKPLVYLQLSHEEFFNMMKLSLQSKIYSKNIEKLRDFLNQNPSILEISQVILLFNIYINSSELVDCDLKEILSAINNSSTKSLRTIDLLKNFFKSVQVKNLSQEIKTNMQQIIKIIFNNFLSIGISLEILKEFVSDKACVLHLIESKEFIFYLCRAFEEYEYLEKIEFIELIFDNRQILEQFMASLNDLAFLPHNHRRIFHFIISKTLSLSNYETYNQELNLLYKISKLSNYSNTISSFITINNDLALIGYLKWLKNDKDFNENRNENIISIIDELVGSKKQQFLYYLSAEQEGPVLLTFEIFNILEHEISNKKDLNSLISMIKDQPIFQIHFDYVIKILGEYNKPIIKIFEELFNDEKNADGYIYIHPSIISKVFSEILLLDNFNILLDLMIPMMKRSRHYYSFKNSLLKLVDNKTKCLSLETMEAMVKRIGSKEINDYILNNIDHRFISVIIDRTNSSAEYKNLKMAYEYFLNHCSFEKIIDHITKKKSLVLEKNTSVFQRFNFFKN